jgi:putative ABC transport system permease protein
VIVFVGLGDAFKRAITGQITDSMLGHLQVHRKGYTASIDNLPLDRMLSAKAYGKLADILSGDGAVEAFSPRIRFGAMLSNYARTTNVRLNGVDPAKEQAAAPLLASRIKDRTRTDAILAHGEVVPPEILAGGCSRRR